jgi:hypothetical protein
MKILDSWWAISLWIFLNKNSSALGNYFGQHAVCNLGYKNENTKEENRNSRYLEAHCSVIQSSIAV